MKPIKITTGDICRSEKAYIFETIFNHFWGLDYQLRFSGQPTTTLDLGDGRIEVDESFWKIADGTWLSADSCEPGAVESLLLDGAWSLRQASLPVFWGRAVVANSGQTTQVRFDLFGTIFFLLSRYEEAVPGPRDNHDRFPAGASLLGRNELLSRPIVNEYLEFLWSVIRRHNPGLARRNREFRMIVSHDVDSPFRYLPRPLMRVGREAIGDIIKRRSLGQFHKTMRSGARTIVKGPTADPHYTFDYILDTVERHGNQSTFFFIADRPTGKVDSYYSLQDSEIEFLLRLVATRGHRIGLHGSYLSAGDQDQTEREATLLRTAMDGNGISQSILGSRQHFLRWYTPATFRNLESAAISYDSSLCFAEKPGFRCGICYEYPVYDVVQRRPLALLERPLVAMEVSISSDRYENLGYGEAMASRLAGLKDECRAYAGDFVLLWHNTELKHPDQREVFEAALDY